MNTMKVERIEEPMGQGLVIAFWYATRGGVIVSPAFDTVGQALTWALKAGKEAR